MTEFISFVYSFAWTVTWHRNVAAALTPESHCEGLWHSADSSEAICICQRALQQMEKV